MPKSVITLPVYSSLAPEEALARLALADRLPTNPDGTRWQLSTHQVETYDALRCGDYDVVINSAMTGDGKSLAAQLSTLRDGKSLLMMYPTNELVRDQETQLAQTLDRWQMTGKVHPTTMTGDRIRAIVASGLYNRKADVIRSLVANNEILLTNPDIFHYIAEFYYTRRTDAPDTLLGRSILDQFELFVFDEFHIFEAPQVVATLNAMLLIRAITGPWQPKKFLFLSATPGGLLSEYLQRAGFRVKIIAPAAGGLYLHTTDQPDATRWRPIIRATNVNFWPQRAEEWVEAHEDLLLAFFDEHRPAAKGAFIVNSVATAHRLVERLRPAFERRGLTVLPNTGLTSASVRKASRDADLLIGTSTVDVGVDFRINLLIFESRDAGTFLQRLGRLGRHADDGKGHRFEHFTAHALVPPFIEERLFPDDEDRPAPLHDGEQLTREQLTEAVRGAYPSSYEFRSYAQEWGWVQSAHVFTGLCSPTIKDSYADARERLKYDYRQTFRFSIGAALRTYRELQDEAKPVAEEAQSFRGESPFDCGIVDESPLAQMEASLEDDAREARRGRIKTYDLLMLAANAELTWLEPDEFKRVAHSYGANLSDGEIAKLAGWFRLRAMAAERKEEIKIVVNQRVDVWGADQWGEVQVLQGITLEVSSAEWLNDLNRHLRHRKFVALLCLSEPQEMLRRLNLPPMFPLHSFISLDGTTGSIAFARAALMLYAAVKERGFTCGGGAVIC